MSNQETEEIIKQCVNTMETMSNSIEKLRRKMDFIQTIAITTVGALIGHIIGLFVFKTK